MQIFINVPEDSKKFVNLKPIKGDNSLLKIKKKNQANISKKKTHYF